MMAAWLSVALAGGGALPYTAQTVDKGEVVVRQPLGVSSVGLSERSALEVTPFDLRIGGPRVGVEHAWSLGEQVALSLTPSVAVKSTAKRFSLAVSPTLSWTLGASVLSTSLMVDARLLRRREVGGSTRATLGFDRLEVPLTLVWDVPAGPGAVRIEARVPLRERGASLHYGSASVSYVTAVGRLGVRAGAGVLLGSPRDQYLLGRYHYTFVLPYPRVDLWWGSKR